MAASTTKSTSSTSKSLSVVQRESFFDDAFFKDSWADFDQAMQSILNKFDRKDLVVAEATRPACRDAYNELRLAKIGEDLYASQALQITEKDGKFHAVMDVKNFNPKDLQVRVVDDRVVVEGKYEQKSADGSSMSAKSFYKEFTMPAGADIDGVSTALSKDGVLTVKAPKKEGGDAPGSTAGPVTQSSSSVQQSASFSASSDGSSSVQQSSNSQVSKKVSTSSSSSSSFSSTSSSKVVSSSSSSFSSSATMQSSLGTGGFDDLAKEMQDRMVFSHDNVNLKLPQK